MSFNKNVNPGGNNGLCSPITAFYDGTNDRIFVGMGQAGAATGANVVTMWNVNTQLTNTSGPRGAIPTPTAHAHAPGDSLRDLPWRFQWYGGRQQRKQYSPGGELLLLDRAGRFGIYRSSC